MEMIINLCGWIGAILILPAYFLLSFRLLKPGFVYHLMNRLTPSFKELHALLLRASLLLTILLVPNLLWAEEALIGLSGMSMRLPEGYVPIGSGIEGKGASIHVSRFARSFYDTKKSFLDEHATREKFLSSKERTPLAYKKKQIAGYPGVELTFGYRDKSFIVLLLGDEKKSAIVSVDYPSDMPTEDKLDLRVSLTTLRWDKALQRERLLFLESPKLQLSSRLDNQYVFSPPGTDPVELKGETPILIVAFKNGPTKNFGLDRLIDALTEKPSSKPKRRSRKLGALDADEGIVDNTKTVGGREVGLYILTAPLSYEESLVITGSALWEEFDRWLPLFRDIVDSIRVNEDFSEPEDL